MLLHHSVWSSTNITFCVISFKPSLPNSLFTIKDLTTSLKEVIKAVNDVWHDIATITFPDAICSQAPDETRHQVEQMLLDFVESMWVTELDMMNRGNLPAPHFRVYVSGDIIDDDYTWCRLRNYFMSREYQIKFQNPGTNMIPDCPCSLFHGADHLSERFMPLPPPARMEWTNKERGPTTN